MVFCLGVDSELIHNSMGRCSILTSVAILQEWQDTLSRGLTRENLRSIGESKALE